MADGFDFALRTLAEAMRPEPVLWVDEWAAEHMMLPAGNSAEHGKYRVERTPLAREIMRCLSPGHPCRRVVVRGASQMLKTQVGLNWIAAVMDAAPATILALMPTLPLSKRLSMRIGKTIAAVPKLRGKVAEPRSRDSRNTIDTKEFSGGTLYITTAGSASNLAEIPARYIYGDEIDRWDGDVDGEGDPVKVAEARTTTYRGREKMYYTSSPLLKGYSRITRLFDIGTQRWCHLPCPHCETAHVLAWENVHWDEALTHAWMCCPHCGGVIEESSKPVMQRAALEPGAWIAANPSPDGETESFHVSALYAPIGWIGWLDLAREYIDAQREEDIGNRGPMQVFQNTRLALPYNAGKESIELDTLIARGEDYPELNAPWGVLKITAGVDVQHDRLALSIWGWGRGEECWLLYWGELYGQTVVPHLGAWAELEEVLFEIEKHEGGGHSYLWRDIPHAGGAALRISSLSLDTSDGTATQDAAYSFCRRHRARSVLAVKGASETGSAARTIFSPPRPSVDADKKHKAWKFGLKPYMVGTVAAKDLLLEGRLPLTGNGPGRIHFYKSVRADWFEQITSEVKAPHRSIRNRKVWQKKSGVNNEALDTFIYAFHAARSLKLNLLRESQWRAMEEMLRQRSLIRDDSDAPDSENEAPAAALDLPIFSAVQIETTVSAEPVKTNETPHARKPTVLAAKHPSRPRAGFSITRW